MDRIDELTCSNMSRVNFYFIIPLRPYLEKIEGCRRPDIFRIRPWARHSRIVSGSECVFLCRCTRITVPFPSHALTCSCIFRTTEAGLNKLLHSRSLRLCISSVRFLTQSQSATVYFFCTISFFFFFFFFFFCQHFKVLYLRHDLTDFDQTWSQVPVDHPIYVTWPD